MKYSNTEFIKRKPKKNNLFKKILFFAVFTIIIIVIYNIFLIRISTETEEQDYVFGMRAYVIETDSMEPELEVGDVIIVKKCEPEDLKIGDIVTFSNRGELITHRISNIDQKYQRYTTKGDKNTLNDIEKIRFNDIKGVKILTLPGFWNFISNAKNIMYVVILIIIMLLVFLHGRKSNRRRIVRRIKKKGEDKRTKYNEKNKTDDN